MSAAPLTTGRRRARTVAREPSGDDMIFIDDETKPVIIGTGTEDYINGAWDFGGRDGAIPFAHLYNGAQFIQAAERGGAV